MGKMEEGRLTLDLRFACQAREFRLRGEGAFTILEQ